MSSSTSSLNPCLDHTYYSIQVTIHSPQAHTANHPHLSLWPSSSSSSSLSWFPQDASPTRRTPHYHTLEPPAPLFTIITSPQSWSTLKEKGQTLPKNLQNRSQYVSMCLDPGSIVEERNVTCTGCDNKSHTTTLFLFVFISVSALKLSK